MKGRKVFKEMYGYKMEERRLNNRTERKIKAKEEEEKRNNSR